MGIWRVWKGCLECVGRLSEACGEVVWKVWGGLLDGVGRLSETCG